MEKLTKKPGANPGNTNAQAGEEPATSQLQIRCTPSEKASWVHAADGEKLSEWVRNTLNRRAKMKTLTERMNIKFGKVENAHILKNVNLGLAAYDTLCLICSELNIDLSNVADSDFDSASAVLDDFCNAANDETGYTVSVWFD